eukprot:Tbor_TRINITY_DN5867_c3_g2::TRINITY_DN5867_c3_g2_i1::g.6424::m.6424/K15414/C1QBP; complement component 1 Q subcomponent-binding protein, mitochondrial
MRRVCSAVPAFSVTRFVGAPSISVAYCSALSKALASELADENNRDDLPKMPEPITGWTLQHTEGEQVFKLTKSYKDEVIEVESPFLSVNDDKDDEPHNQFQLTISKENGEAILMQLGIFDGEISIDGFTFCADKKKAEHPVDGAKLYSGPDIGDLPPELSDQLPPYLETRGVNDDLGAYVSDVSNYLEQKEYMRMLKKAAEFTK